MEKKSDEELKQIKPSVTYLCWDQSDRWIITACTDMTIKVWDSFTSELLQVMTGHKKEVYVLESHPFHSKVCTGSYVYYNIFKLIYFFLNLCYLRFC